MAPLVGLPVGELMPASLPQGTAPAEIGAGGWGGATVQTGAAKLAGSFALKAVLAAGALSVGLGLWWAQQSPAAPRQVGSTVSAPMVVAPVETRAAPSAEPAPVAAPEPVLLAPKSEPSIVTAKPGTSATARPDELALIAQAQGLRDQPQALLKVLKQHATWYPHGMLAQEREVLAVEALLAAGQIEAGKRRAARLEAEFPNSAHLPRIHALLKSAGHE
jgi:hypothetical protein